MYAIGVLTLKFPGSVQLCQSSGRCRDIFCSDTETLEGRWSFAQLLFKTLETRQLGSLVISQTLQNKQFPTTFGLGECLSKPRSDIPLPECSQFSRTSQLTIKRQRTTAPNAKWGKLMK
eukprot:3756764-Amphidinium_carterae.1